jgi:Ser/Thr protein kinase RdoA (MazF antagonist)
MERNGGETAICGGRMAYSAEHSDVFQELDAERILTAVESSGMRATGRMLQLNSMENRVFSVEIEPEEEGARPYQVIAKFYRPGRWTADQILSEHLLQLLLAEEDIPTPRLLPIRNRAVAVSGTVSMGERLAPEVDIALPDHPTLGRSGPYFFCLWEKVVGRAPLELKPGDLEQLGRIVARMHNLFETRIHSSNFVRNSLSSQLFGVAAIKNVDRFRFLPAHLARAIIPLCEELAAGLSWVDTCMPFIPIHGDLHRLNLVQTCEGGSFWLVDFDDCVWGPEIHDLWLLASACDLSDVPGERRSPIECLIAGYEEFRRLPADSELLIEPLRTLRMLNYMGWIAARWSDRLFRETFTFFTEESYWEKSLFDLERQRELLLELGLMSYESP